MAVEQKIDLVARNKFILSGYSRTLASSWNWDTLEAPHPSANYLSTEFTIANNLLVPRVQDKALPPGWTAYHGTINIDNFKTDPTPLTLAAAFLHRKNPVSGENRGAPIMLWRVAEIPKDVPSDIDMFPKEQVIEDVAKVNELFIEGKRVLGLPARWHSAVRGGVGVVVGAAALVVTGSFLPESQLNPVITPLMGIGGAMAGVIMGLGRDRAVQRNRGDEIPRLAQYSDGYTGALQVDQIESHIEKARIQAEVYAVLPPVLKIREGEIDPGTFLEVFGRMDKATDSFLSNDRSLELKKQKRPYGALADPEELAKITSLEALAVGVGIALAEGRASESAKLQYDRLFAQRLTAGVVF